MELGIATVRALAPVLVMVSLIVGAVGARTYITGRQVTVVVAAIGLNMFRATIITRLFLAKGSQSNIERIGNAIATAMVTVVVIVIVRGIP